FMATFAVVAAIFASITIYIDPFFHYHFPLENYGYPLNNERYQNDGITRYFDYDAIVTGTSITQPFAVTAVNECFGVNAIKVCYSGASFKELDAALKRAIKRNPDVKMVLRGLDGYGYIADKDSIPYEGMPNYLYNNNPLDDVEYVLNKEVLFYRTLYVMEYTKNGGKTTTFDEYSVGSDPFGKEYALSYVKHSKKVKKKQIALSEEEKQMIIDNVRQNLVETAQENPDITFYYFLSPYSVLDWDKKYRSGRLQYQIDIERIVIEELLQCENIRLFSFDTAEEIVADLDRYRDTTHVDQATAILLTQYMKEGKYRITKENYEEYLSDLYELYKNYDYDAIYE
nr:hypothetical protein [Lachnospiraceae bacterium]